MSGLVDLKRDQSQANYIYEAARQEYPANLRIVLETSELEMFGLDPMPAVGSVVSFRAVAVVSSVSFGEKDANQKQHRSLTLQLTQMGNVDVKDGRSQSMVMYETEDA